LSAPTSARSAAIWSFSLVVAAARASKLPRPKKMMA
jgi:hypothetical protein